MEPFKSISAKELREKFNAGLSNDTGDVVDFSKMDRSLSGLFINSGASALRKAENGFIVELGFKLYIANNENELVKLLTNFNN